MVEDGGSSLTQKIHNKLATTTKFLDNNIRTVQYVIYGVAGLAVYRILHSVRAFSRFDKVADIPHEFVRKNIRLRGKVQCVTSTPITRPGPRGTDADFVQLDANRNLLPGEQKANVEAAHSSLRNVDGVDTAPMLSDEQEATNLDKNTNIIAQGQIDCETSQLFQNKERFVNSNGPEYFAGGKNGLFLSQKRSEELKECGLEQDFVPVYLEVQHVPVFGLLARSAPKALPIRLASILVPANSVAGLGEQLQGRLVWFQLYLLQQDVAVCTLVKKKFGIWGWRTINEDLIRKGNAIVSELPSVESIKPLTTPRSLSDRVRNSIRTLVHGPPMEQAALTTELNSEAWILGVPPSYQALHDRFLLCEARARRKRVGVWGALGPDPQRSLLMRLWQRFRVNMSQMDRTPRT